MATITVFDGATTIGGNKIYVEENNSGVFLDFGKNFKTYGKYFQEFLNPRSIRGLNDLLQLDLIPKIGNYRTDLVPSDLDITTYPKLDIEAVLLTHAHQDHFGNIGMLDPEIPLVCSPITMAFLKGILDSANADMTTEVAYFTVKNTIDSQGKIMKSKGNKHTRREFYTTESSSDALCDFMERPAKSKKSFNECREVSDLQSVKLPFEVEAYNVDHSIYGATAYILKGDTIIAYTGDFRLHGKQAKSSQEFLKNAKNASVLISEGTRVGHESATEESEEIVRDSCREVIELASDLVIADFSNRHIERLETFSEIATEVGREIVIPAKTAYILHSLEQIDGVDRLQNYLIYDELKSRKLFWETETFVNTPLSNLYITSENIAKNPENYILCFSFFDLKHLLDIRPEKGTYVYSSSEAFDEESEFDFQRLDQWLKYFNFEVFGFELNRKGSEFELKFEKRFHASGHISQTDLFKAIKEVDPDIIIPVHTENPKWFAENFDNVKLADHGNAIKV